MLQLAVESIETNVQKKILMRMRESGGGMLKQCKIEGEGGCILVDRCKKKQGVGPQMTDKCKDKEMKNSDGMGGCTEGWCSGVKNSRREKQRERQRQEEWMMNREHSEVIKSSVDSFMATCS